MKLSSLREIQPMSQLVSQATWSKEIGSSRVCCVSKYGSKARKMIHVQTVLLFTYPLQGMKGVYFLSCTPLLCQRQRQILLILIMSNGDHKEAQKERFYTKLTQYC